MKIETLTYIEVENEPHLWAVQLDECKPEMKPITMKYVFVHNDLSSDRIIIDNTITDRKPEKIIEGVTGGISDDFIEVGFWKIKS